MGYAINAVFSDDLLWDVEESDTLAGYAVIDDQRSSARRAVVS